MSQATRLAEETDFVRFLQRCATQAIPGELDRDEECVEQQYFINLRSQLEVALRVLQDRISPSAFSAFPKCSSKLPVELIVLLAGCHGNQYSKQEHYALGLDELADKIIAACLRCYGFQSVKEWLLLADSATNAGQLCRRSLIHLTQLLSKSTIKRLPFHRDACVWLMGQLTYPDLSDYLPYVLPVALQIVDDYRLDLKLQGIACLRHIGRHCLKAEMRYFGQADVIYDSLKKLTYSHEGEIIRAIYPCLLEFLATFDPSPCQRSASRELTYKEGYDELFDKLLNDIYIESRVLHRQVLVGHLQLFLPIMGISSVKHSKRFLQAFENALLNSFGAAENTQLVILKCGILFVKYAWPLLDSFLIDFFRTMFAFLDEENAKYPPDVVVELQSLLKLLCAFDPKLFTAVVGERFKNSSIVSHVLNNFVQESPIVQ